MRDGGGVQHYRTSCSRGLVAQLLVGVSTPHENPSMVPIHLDDKFFVLI